MNKQISLTGLILLIGSLTYYAQGQTNTFPPSGNVGVGTVSPTAKLQIKSTGTIGAKWDPGKSYLTLSSGSNYLIMDPNEIYASGTMAIGTNSGDIKFRTVTASSFLDAMTIRSGGNVGIGTVNPYTKLDVNGVIASNSQMNVRNPSNAQASISLSWKDNISRLRIGGNDEGAANGMDIQTVGDRSLMRLLHNGNVGIGTTTPFNKLEVNGTIRAKEVKLEASPWPDYVFEEAYDLPDLNEVEDFIKSNGRLKDIPSAKEVETNGVLLGEMNAKLLQKIEELILYTIAQEKALEDKEQRVHHLEERLTQLEGIVTALTRE